MDNRKQINTQINQQINKIVIIYEIKKIHKY